MTDVYIILCKYLLYCYEISLIYIKSYMNFILM